METSEKSSFSKVPPFKSYFPGCQIPINGSFQLVSPQYVMLSPFTEHESLQSKSLCKKWHVRLGVEIIRSLQELRVRGWNGGDVFGSMLNLKWFSIHLFWAKKLLKTFIISKNIYHRIFSTEISFRHALEWMINKKIKTLVQFPMVSYISKFWTLILFL